MFLHSGWLHIGGNTLSLWIFGDNIEAMGHVRFLLFPSPLRLPQRSQTARTGIGLPSSASGAPSPA
jgi:hypothetical protein